MRKQTLHGINQGQVTLLLAADKKERAKRAGIVMTALLTGQENIAAAYDNGDMVDDAIKIPQDL